MIQITDFTSYDEIRAIIGVDSIELPDANIETAANTSALTRALRTFSTSTGSLLSVIDALPADKTDDEEYLYNTACEYAALIVAEACCTGLSMFALKSDSDGKASQSRFSGESTFRDVLANIRARLATVIGALDELINETTTYTVGGLYIVTPAVDKVTNE